MHLPHFVHGESMSKTFRSPMAVSVNMEMHLNEGHSYYGSRSCGPTHLHWFDVFLLFVLNNGVVGEAFLPLTLSINHVVLFLLIISNLNFNPVFLFLPFILSMEHVVPVDCHQL